MNNFGNGDSFQFHYRKQYKIIIQFQNLAQTNRIDWQYFFNGKTKFGNFSQYLIIVDGKNIFAFQTWRSTITEKWLYMNWLRANLSIECLKNIETSLHEEKFAWNSSRNKIIFHSGNDDFIIQSIEWENLFIYTNSRAPISTNERRIRLGKLQPWYKAN